MHVVDTGNSGSLIGHSADALYQPAMQNKINSNEVVHQLPTMVVFTSCRLEQEGGLRRRLM